MSDSTDGWEALGVASALARNYATDARSFLPLLAQVLSTSLPTETEVERKGGWFVKEKPVNKVTVHLGDEHYCIEDAGHGTLSATRIKIVRGIKLKNEPMPIESWIADLSAEIGTRASRNEAAFFALKELLG